MSELNNVFAEVLSQLPQEELRTLLTSDKLRIERIVSHGHASPDGFWYDQQEHEWVLLLQGNARLQFEDRVVVLVPGDYLNIAAHERHRVEWTTPDEPTIWLALFYS